VDGRLTPGDVLHDLAVRGIAYHVVSGPIEKRIAQVKALLDAGDAGRGRRSQT
jgi:hypothetical protein